MAEPRPSLAACPACGADWAGGRWKTGCTTCDGGSLSRACLSCEGRCGEVWFRIRDGEGSQFGFRWVGACRLLDGTLA